MKKTVLFILLFFNLFINAQINQNDTIPKNKNVKFKYDALIIPSVLIGFGFVGLESHSIKDLNSDTKNELGEHIDEKITIDDFSQYLPFVSVYALNAAGIKGKNNFKDRTIILATSYLIMGGTVNLVKMTGNEMRPDGTSNNSFPSGHTATAFMGAEFLYQEYKDVSVWYGITGYVVATGTGLFRMYNNRHWLTDVSAGAGIGILSTKIAYWLHPIIKRHIFKDSDKLSGVIVPTYNGGKIGMGMAIRF
ncbi:phosphatase PAP2 family protein [Flavobacterium sp. NRK F7]|uniref:phosphatase PAP2 family protein n=1 Tax=Flavobacterium sp. NRK F7 TaxID=2954930 RepID=UPI002090CB48|nr:phosphatase PAP2 family protein [Flavobacterium sp. NRK F7]MCO6162558.1 phosphatase PAP2 family protein [Flavobacterium sp. NRK F7]